jgi:NAD(P)-dependent dehydrogenase (short-subunit alcohol dehydrogenase family)
MRRDIAAGLIASYLLASTAGMSTAAAETVLVSGANSGLGLEFVKQYAARNWDVIATHRRTAIPASLMEIVAEHPNVRVERMDVASVDEVEALAKRLEGTTIDVLINNAGVYSDRSTCEDEACGGRVDTQHFGHIDYDLFDTIMAVNARGPLLVSEKFIGHVRASAQKKIVSISSTNASLTQQQPGAYAISYRASKAALNRLMQLVARHEREMGVTVLLLHPGAVITERQSSPTADMIELEPSVAGMIDVIDRATIDDTGRFLQYDGGTVPW